MLPGQPGRAGPRILSIDGGGIRGVLVLDVLRTIERIASSVSPGTPLLSLFDVVCGTSTGAFIACALAAGKSLDDIERQYGLIQPMFAPTGGALSIFTRLWRGHCIDHDTLMKLTEDFFGDATLEALPSTPRLLVVATAVDGSPPHPLLFRSHALSPAQAARLTVDAIDAGRIADVVRGAVAAPTYIKSHRFPTPAPAAARTGSGGGAAAARLVADGGIHSANPILFAIAEAAALWPGLAPQVLSLGTGSETGQPHVRTPLPAALPRGAAEAGQPSPPSPAPPLLPIAVNVSAEPVVAANVSTANCD